MSVRVIPNPWGDFRTKHGVKLYPQWMEYDGGDEPSGKDISDARYTARVRAYNSSGTAVFDVELDKHADSAKQALGHFNHYLPLGTTAMATMLWVIVGIDNSNADGDTLTGKQETILMAWRESIRASTP